MKPIELTAVLTLSTLRLERKRNRAVLSKLRDLDVESQPEQSLHKRLCKRSNSCSDVSRLCGDSTDTTAFSRDRFGSKGVFLKHMQYACLPVPPFECIDTRILNAIEQHPIDFTPIKGNLPDMEEAFYGSKHSLVEMKVWASQLSPTDKVKRSKWLNILSEFIASDAFYKQVKDSFAAGEIRTCHHKLFSPFNPVIVRSSGVADDCFADALAGKYQSIVHGKGDIVQTCLKVMASGYCSRACLQGGPQPMAIILQEYINCSFGGVATSSLQDKTIRVEYVPGQPKGAVTGHSDMKPHGYIIKRDERQITSTAFTRGNSPATFVLEKVDADSGFMEVTKTTEDASVSGCDELSDDTLKILHHCIKQLENLLCSPVEIEFGIDLPGRLILIQVVIPPPGILDLPAEIITKVVSMLPMNDIKNFKVICKHINEIIDRNHLVETCWFNRFSSDIQKKIGKLFSRQNYESNLKPCIQQFDNNVSADIFDEIISSDTFPINLSFYVARTLTEAPGLKLVGKANFDFNPDSFDEPYTLSPDGNHLTTTDSDYKIKLIGLNNQGEWVVKRISEQGDRRTTTYFSPDSCHLVIAHCDGKVELYSMNSLKRWIRNDNIDSDVDSPPDVTISPDSRHLVIASRAGKAKLYRLGVSNDAIIETTRVSVGDVTFSPDGRHLIIIFEDGKATLYRLDSCLEVWTKYTIEYGDLFNDVIFSLDSRHLVIGSRDGQATLYSLNSLRAWDKITPIDHDGAQLDAVIFSSDSLHLMTQSDNSLMLHSLNSQGMWEESCSSYSIRALGIDSIDLVDFSPNSCHVAICQNHGKSTLLSLDSQGKWADNGFFEYDGWIKSVEFSPDSRHVVIVSEEDNLEAGTPEADDDDFIESKLISLNQHGVWVEKDTTRNSCTEHCIQPCDELRFQTTYFSLGGSPLVFTFHDGVATLITLNSQGKWAKKATMEGDSIISATFSPEGRHLVVTSRDEVHVFEILPFYPEDPPDSEQMTVP